MAQTMEKSIITMVMVVIMATIMTQVAQAAAPAPPTYCCPLCTDVCFYTYDELYSHFVTAHPTEDIDIIWD